MTDPGFPQGGGVNPPRGGREHAILPNSPKNCMKLKEFGRRGGGVRPSRPPLDPPLQLDLYKVNFAVIGTTASSSATISVFSFVVFCSV